MIKVGVTGGIGSGKSTVCRMLCSLSGAPLYDCDGRARELMDSDAVIIEGVKSLFGSEAYRDGRLDRRLVAERIFAYRSLMERLNAIVHPRVIADFENWCRMQKAPYVVLESALIFSSPLDGMFDVTVAVDAPDNVRVDRCVLRDDASPEDVRRRMASQTPRAEFLARADRIIFNDGRPLDEQVAALHAYIKSLADETV